MENITLIMFLKKCNLQYKYDFPPFLFVFWGTDKRICVAAWPLAEEISWDCRNFQLAPLNISDTYRQYCKNVCWTCLLKFTEGWVTRLRTLHSQGFLYSKLHHTLMTFNASFKTPLNHTIWPQLLSNKDKSIFKEYCVSNVKKKCHAYNVKCIILLYIWHYI